MNSQTVLITGCSSGIGAKTAELAHARGHTVVASARNTDALDGLPDGVVRVEIDVADPESITRGVKEAVAAVGPITAAVNNAGYAEAGPIELVPEERLERQFQTNVFGAIRVAREVLPGMRENKHGTIVNVSSMGALVVSPFLGVYCASKAALEALSDALRLEVRSHGVRVALIAPGPIDTRFSETAYGDAEERWLNDPANPYSEGMRRTIKITERFTSIEKQPNVVAETILRAIEDPRTKARYPVTTPAYVVPSLLGIVPTRFRDALSVRILRL